MRRRRFSRMTRTILIYALVLAGAVFLLEWLEYKYVTRVFAGEIYIVLIAAAFTALGGWAGWRLTQKTKPASGPFAPNDAALRALGVTAREYETLALLAAGMSNKEIARALAVSPNTVKTHLARLYEKLEVSRRTQAVRKARDLALIP
ncbi:MAG: response regulator transcription factor [Hyphococcus sp.]